MAALPASIKAGEIMPDFGSTLPPASTSWFTDRYEPNTFVDVGAFQGRSDVLGLGIGSAQDLANRPAGYGYTFYNTQGRQHPAVGGDGSTLSADLWVDAAWGDAANGSVRTDLWGVMTDSTAAISAYPILGFTNYGGTPRFRYWTDAGWVDLDVAVNYGAWNTLSIGFTNDTFTYSINGALVAVDRVTDGSTGFADVIVQAYNFADPGIAGANPTDYVAHWANVQQIPDAGSSLILLGSALLGLALFGRRLARKHA